MSIKGEVEVTVTEVLRSAGRALTSKEVAAQCGIPASDAFDQLEELVDAGEAVFIETIDRYRLTGSTQPRQPTTAPRAASSGPTNDTIAGSVTRLLRWMGPTMTSAKIREHLPGRPADSVNSELSKMVRRGQLIRVENGVFSLPAEEKDEPEDRQDVPRESSEPEPEPEHEPDLGPEPEAQTTPTSPDDELRRIGIEACLEQIESVLMPLHHGRYPEPSAFQRARARLDLLERLAETAWAGRSE